MIRFSNVSFRYPLGNYALRSISFEVAPGEFLLVLGHNGAGKSTLLRLFNGILKPTDGMVEVHGLNTREHATSHLAQFAAVTFQHPEDQIFATTVEREVAYGATALQRADRHDLAEHALRLFNLYSKRLSHPYDLPPSSRKLITIASAAASGCPVLAFDEPSAGLSVPERELLTKGIRQLLGQNRLMIVVSHDLDLFLPLSSRVIIVQDGAIVYNGSPLPLITHEALLRQTRLKLPFVTRLRKAVNLTPFSY